MRSFTIKRIGRVCFTRIGYEVQILNADGSPHEIYYHNAASAGGWLTSEPMRFYGDDGRKVRAEAIAWAKQHLVEG